jgi:predicted ATPase
MSYRYSNDDNTNIGWFLNDPTRQSLFCIHLELGELRGLRNLLIEFKYPITAIAGKNGTGKTTLLALAACAFHNIPDGFKLPGRKYPYYTFSDFFVQADGEKDIDNISINYHIFHNNWNSSKRLPKGVGVGRQCRKKNKDGRWNNYDSRVDRTVVYLGINRIVPHIEKSASKSYRKLFKASADQGWESRVKDIGARIFARNYSKLETRRHGKYTLLVLSRDDCTYSGFNMGAGEDSTFELLSIIMQCPKGALLVIDEIELGLHDEVQKRLICELKKLCTDRHIQIICTTHSSQILSALPPEGRIFLESVGENVKVTPGVSAKYATGKLRGSHSEELDILVEDGVARRILESVLSLELRQRVNIVQIGSSTAVMRHMCSRFREQVCISDGTVKKENSPTIFAILDGDKSTDIATQKRIYLESLESAELKAAGGKWLDERLFFLPGTSWPEAWVLDKLNDDAIEKSAVIFNTSHDELADIVEKARISGKHNEFYTCAEALALDIEYVTRILIREAVANAEEYKAQLLGTVSRILENKVGQEQPKSV